MIEAIALGIIFTSIILFILGRALYVLAKTV
jgi:hypothetical protein